MPPDPPIMGRLRGSCLCQSQTWKPPSSNPGSATAGALLPFTKQGLEKYNDSMTKDYFRSTSHKGQECLTQILQKQNRMEYLEHAGAKREKKFHVTCSTCGTKGHNKKTYPNTTIPLLCLCTSHPMTFFMYITSYIHSVVSN